MKSLAAAVALVLILSAGAGGTSGSGLRGKVLIDPGYPVCKVGVPCARLASHVWLEFWRRGRVVARTRTDNKGRYRITLAPRVYSVTSSKRASALQPQRVEVRAGSYRRVTFKIDIEIR